MEPAFGPTTFYWLSHEERIPPAKRLLSKNEAQIMPGFSPIRSAALGLIIYYAVLVTSGQVNFTIDDNDGASLIFSPPEFWFASTNSSPCAFCLAPQDHNAASDGTWHFGLHVIPTADSDDVVVAEKTQEKDKDQDGDDDQGGKDSDQDSGKGTKHGQSRSPRALHHSLRDAVPVLSNFTAPSSTAVPAVANTGSPFFTQKLDSDDPGFVDPPIFVQFNFTGTAVYVNCLLPLGMPPNSNSTPTQTNLTFSVDSQPMDVFVFSPVNQSPSFLPNATVFKIDGLPFTPHTLRIDLGQNSVFLLDSIVFTQDSSAVANSTRGNSTPAASDVAPTAVESPRSSSNTVTFAGAIGGVVGVIAAIALCTALSIIYRRHKSAKRILAERERNSDAESFHTFDGEDDERSGPEMRGPEPFTPRFFPNTVPSNPPRYVPPEPITTEDSVDVPPPFAVAIASPEPPLLASVMRRPFEHLQPLSSHTPTDVEGSDSEEPGTTSPLMVSYSLRHPRPPSFRSVGSDLLSTPATSHTRPTNEHDAPQTPHTGSERLSQDMNR